MKKGFSIIEILIVLAILGILTTIILTSLVVFNKSQALNKDTETIVESLRLAQDQTISSKGASQYGVHFASSTVSIFTGTTYSSSDTTNQVFTLKTSDLVMGVNLTGGGKDVIFNRLTGETADDGSITISSQQANQTKTVTIYKTGIIQAPGL